MHSCKRPVLIAVTFMSSPGGPPLTRALTVQAKLQSHVIVLHGKKEKKHTNSCHRVVFFFELRRCVIYLMALRQHRT